MFNFITNLFKSCKPQPQPHLPIFSEQYRSSYNKLWIQKLRNYYPK